MDTQIIKLDKYYSCLMGDCPMHCCNGWTIPVEIRLIQERSCVSISLEKVTTTGRLKKSSAAVLFLQKKSSAECSVRRGLT